MGYGLTGRIIDLKSKRLLGVCNLDFMKSLGNMSYSAEFSNIHDVSGIKTSDYPTLAHVHMSFKGAYSRDVLERFDAAEEYPYSWDSRTPSFAVSTDDYDKHSDGIGDFAISRSDDPRDRIILYTMSVEVDSGSWYDKSCFEHALCDVMKHLTECTDQLDACRAIRYSKEYYEMSDSAKDSLDAEIICIEESISSYSEDVSSLTKIIDILDFYENDLGVPYDDSTGIKYDMVSWDERSVGLYISVD